MKNKLLFLPLQFFLVYCTGQNYDPLIPFKEGEIVQCSVDSIEIVGFVPHETINDVNVVTPQVAAYLKEIDYSTDSDYLHSYVADYRPSIVADLSLPLPVVINWDNYPESLQYKIEVSYNKNYQDAFIYFVADSLSSYCIYNLIPQRDYFVRVSALMTNNREIAIKTYNISTVGDIRQIYIPGSYVGNFRDLGGWICDNNKKIKYGRLIRGAEVYRCDSGIFMEISSEGIYELKERLGFSVELDFGDLWDKSPLEGYGFEIYKEHNKYGFYAYDSFNRGIRSVEGLTCLHNCLSLVIQKLSEGKNVYFHCNSGADRTGVLAFFIEALCGVSDSDKSKDYELSSFWGYYQTEPYKKMITYLTRKRNSDKCGYRTMVKYIENHFAGITLNEKVYNMCVTDIESGGLELTQEEIKLLRSTITENR